MADQQVEERNSKGDHRSDRNNVSLPVVAQSRRLVAFALVLVVVAAAAFIGGTLVRAPQQSALDATAQHLSVTYTVENRVVASGVVLVGKVLLGKSDPLLPLASSSGADRLVVTRKSLEVGQTIVPGTFLGEVSGTPLISIPRGVPLYRDLVDGSIGADVSALQAALQQMGLDVSVTGEIGPRTLAGVADLFARFDMVPADSSVIAWSSFLPVSDGAVVTSVAEIGSIVDDDTPLATVTSSAAAITARATVIQADLLQPGQVVTVRAGTAVAESTVLSVGDFTEFADGSGSGREITVAVPDELELDPAQPITLSTTAEAEPGPAVPIVALRQDDQGSYVELAPDLSMGSAEDSAPERVYVRVLAQAEGWAAIEPDSLDVGTRILVKG